MRIISAYISLVASVYLNLSIKTLKIHSFETIGHSGLLLVTACLPYYQLMKNIKRNFSLVVNLAGIVTNMCQVSKGQEKHRSLDKDTSCLSFFHRESEEKITNDKKAVGPGFKKAKNTDTKMLMIMMI